MLRRGSNSNVFCGNVSTKSKIVGFHDKTLYEKQIQDTGNKVGEYYDGVIAAEWDGRTLYFDIDETIENDQFNLVNHDNMEAVPRRSYEGGSVMYQMAEETENSARIHTTLRSELSLEVKRAENMAVCKNI